MEPDTCIITNYGRAGSLLYLQSLAKALEAIGCRAAYYLPRGTDLGMVDPARVYPCLREPSVAPGIFKKGSLKYLYHLYGYFYNALTVRPAPGTKVAHLLFPFYLTDAITIRRLKRRGIKVVLTVHEGFPHKPFLGGRADRALVGNMLRKADLLAAHTLELKEEITGMYNIALDKIKVIPHGVFESPRSLKSVEELKQAYGVPEGKKIILFFGSIRDNKGLDVLIEAFEGLRQECFLLIAGQVAGASEPPASRYRQALAANRLEDSALWVEREIPDAQVGEFFKMADLLVLPYKRSFHAQSGVLNMAVGFDMPCVASDVGGIGQSVVDYSLGTVVEPESPEALREGIQAELNANKDYGFSRYKAENSWEATAQMLSAEYEKLKGSSY